MKKDVFKMFCVLGIEGSIIIAAIALAAYMFGMANGSPLLQWLLR